jgi:hypothetical protein
MEQGYVASHIKRGRKCRYARLLLWDAENSELLQSFYVWLGKSSYFCSGTVYSTS